MSSLRSGMLYLKQDFLEFKSFLLVVEKTLLLKIWFNNCERLSLIKCALFGLLADRSTLDREADLQKSNLDPCGAAQANLTADHDGKNISEANC